MEAELRISGCGFGLGFTAGDGRPVCSLGMKQLVGVGAGWIGWGWGWDKPAGDEDQRCGESGEGCQCLSWVQGGERRLVGEGMGPAVGHWVGPIWGEGDNGGPDQGLF